MPPEYFPAACGFSGQIAGTLCLLCGFYEPLQQRGKQPAVFVLIDDIIGDIGFRIENGDLYAALRPLLALEGKVGGKRREGG